MQDELNNIAECTADGMLHPDKESDDHRRQRLFNDKDRKKKRHHDQ